RGLRVLDRRLERFPREGLRECEAPRRREEDEEECLRGDRLRLRLDFFFLFLRTERREGLRLRLRDGELECADEDLGAGAALLLLRERLWLSALEGAADPTEDDGGGSVPSKAGESARGAVV